MNILVFLAIVCSIFYANKALKCYQCIQHGSDDCKGVEVDYNKVDTDIENAFKENNKTWHEADCPSNADACVLNRFKKGDTVITRLCNIKKEGGKPLLMMDRCAHTHNNGIDMVVCTCNTDSCNKDVKCEPPAIDVERTGVNMTFCPKETDKCRKEKNCS